jgi:3-oxoacyl-[acyl-carrier protein] reductase
MFKNKVVLITGASRGIGKATAIKFGKLGANVIVNYVRNQNSANDVVEEIKKLGGNAVAIQSDISIKEELDKLVELSLQIFGKIDILVNNAGIVYDREFEDITYEESLQIVKTNMLAPLFLTQKIAPIMVANGGGNIVNVSSTSGLHDFNPGTTDYAMSKIALQSLTKDLSLKYGTQNIRVNAIAPGWVNTDMNSDLPADFVKSETEKYHLKRWASPEEIADSIIYLASDNASYITGQVLIVDGGHC